MRSGWTASSARPTWPRSPSTASSAARMPWSRPPSSSGASSGCTGWPTPWTAGATTPRIRFDGLWDELEAWFDEEPFRGSLVANAATELRSEPDHPAQARIAQHRQALRQLLEDLAKSSGAYDPAVLSTQVRVLLDGAISAASGDTAKSSEANHSSSASQSAPSADPDETGRPVTTRQSRARQSPAAASLLVMPLFYGPSPCQPNAASMRENGSRVRVTSHFDW
jgi:hypothetical protein